jgi:hypothetical protein
MVAAMIHPTLPPISELQPHLDKLEANQGSVVLIAIEVPEVCNFSRVTVGWFSKGERDALRKALLKARAKRQSHQEGRGDLAAKESSEDSQPKAKA